MGRHGPQFGTWLLTQGDGIGLWYNHEWTMATFPGHLQLTHATGEMHIWPWWVVVSVGRYPKQPADVRVVELEPGA